jgi:alpha 1,2-mannosyltransferase
VRRTIATLFIFSVVVVFIRNSHNLKWEPIWGSRIPSRDHCSEARNNPGQVLLPPPPNQDYHVNLYLELYDLFSKNPPQPYAVNKPTHDHNSLGEPTKEEMANFIKLTKEDLIATRKAHEKVIKALPNYPDGAYNGRGIVILAGGQYSEYASTALGMLRELNSSLSVEVWMANREEERAGWCTELAREGMACRFLSDYMSGSVMPSPFQWKIMAMIFSSFKDILFLDADNIPLMAPDFMFDTEGYKEYGVTIWPDYWKHTGPPWLPYIIGMTEAPSTILEDEKQKTAESGQVMWNKGRHWKVSFSCSYPMFNNEANNLQGIAAGGILQLSWSQFLLQRY